MIKVLHLPVSTGGQAWNLSRAERALGIESKNLVFRSTSFLYEYDENLKIDRFPFIFRPLMQLMFFFKYIRSYNIFHFYSAASFLPLNLDLPIIKLFKKKVFVTFQGSDIRRSKISTEYKSKLYKRTFRYLNPKLDIIKKIRVLMFEKFSNKSFVLNPDLLLCSKKSLFLPYVYPTASVEYKKGFSENNKLRVVHAPTNRKIKGTPVILEVIKNLKNKGYPIEFTLLEGLPHNEVAKQVKNADVIIDQLYVGWYGVFAVEMMARGIPVICYIDKEVASILPFYNDIPIITTGPESLSDTIIELINNKNQLQRISKKSLSYVKNIHNDKKIAQEMISHYKND